MPKRNCASIPYVRGNVSERNLLCTPHADISALLENRNAESPHIAKREAKVGSTLLLQFLLAAIGCDALH